MHSVPSGDDEHHPSSLVRTVDGRTGWCSGVLPMATDGTIETEPEAAVAAALRTLGERLERAGASLQDVVKITAYLADIGWRPVLDAAWRRTWDEPRPARTALQVSALPRGALLELDAVVQLTEGT